MGQLSLELRQYPRPIAWTISEVDRAVGNRDRRDMMFSAFEEIIRYLVLLELARYTEYSTRERGDDAIEHRLLDLQRPSFGHYLGVLTALDRFLAEAGDPYALRISEKRELPRIVQFLRETGDHRAKSASVSMLLQRVIELRNRNKGHGYTGQHDARKMNETLQPALVELLEKTPLLIDLPLVWIESIEYIGPRELTVTFLELMGTQRARRLTRKVYDPGTLKKGFLYMWNGESAPLQMTPFLHLEESDQDELVYVLAGISGEPTYQARGSSSGRRPDQLMSQLEERVPFLLKPRPAVTASRAPEAAKLYAQVVELALSDGHVTEAEAGRLAIIRQNLGIGSAECLQIHRELGWVDGPSSSNHQRSSDNWPDIGRALAVAAREAAVDKIAQDIELVLLDPDLDVRKGRLWFQLGATQGVALSYSDRAAEHLEVAVGFYSQRPMRDPQYRRARKAIEADTGPNLADGWAALGRESTLPGVLSLETRKHFTLSSLSTTTASAEIASVISTIYETARIALTHAADASRPTAPVVDLHPPISASVPLNFPLPGLRGSLRLQGSVWLPRILWALEYARRSNATPRSAADIARILQENGVDVPATNTARAFRTAQDDPRITGLCEEPTSQRYVISGKGRRILFEWLASLPQTSSEQDAEASSPVAAHGK